MAVICQPHLNEAEEGGNEEAIPRDERDADPVEQFNEKTNQGVGERKVLQSIEEAQSLKQQLQHQGCQGQNDDEHPPIEIQLRHNADEHDETQDGSQADGEDRDKGVSDGLLVRHQGSDSDCTHYAEEMSHPENAKFRGGEHRLKGSDSQFGQQGVQENIRQQRIICDGDS